MAETVEKTTQKKKTTTKNKKSSSPLIGSQIQTVTLDSTTKLDIDTNKTLVDEIIDSGLSNKLDTSALENFTTISNSRDQMYQTIDTMCADSTVSALIRVYAENVCEPSDTGHIVWCESNNPNISKFVNYLLNVMNVDKNIFSWTYNLVKYGDTYLKLYRESDYEDPLFKKDTIDSVQTTRSTLNESIDSQLTENMMLNVHTASDKYSGYVEMVADPCTMFELTKYGKTYGYIETPNEDTNLTLLSSIGTYNDSASALVSNYKMKSNNINVYQADDYVHACLDDNFTRFPEKISLFMTDSDYESETNAHTYNVKRGKSILYDSYKIWREKSLLEDSVLLSRVTKSNITRKISVEVGDMPKEQVKLTLRRVKELFEQRTAVKQNNGMSEYTNPGPIENNVYFATHNGQGAISVDVIGGDANIKDIADVDWWNNKFYSSYGVPKQYLGWTDDGAGFNGGSSLTLISSIFAKSVKRIQNAMIQALTDAINLILLNRGCKSYLNNFVLKMKAPLTQEEKDYRDDLSNRISAISNMQSLFSDIEDKTTKLEILKTLVRTLDYGDELIDAIQTEINAAEQAKQAEKEEKEKAEKEAAEAATKNSTDNSAPEAESDMDLDLGNSNVTESLQADISNTKETDVNTFDLTETLPTPEELDSSIDFSKNN